MATHPMNAEKHKRPRHLVAHQGCTARLRPIVRAVRAGLLLGAAAFLLPNNAPALSFTCPVSGSVAITGAESNSDTCDILGTGSVDIQSPSGALTNETNGTLNNAGSLTSSGYLENKGNLNNLSGGWLSNNAFSNSGSLMNDAGAQMTLGGAPVNTGTITNSGTISDSNTELWNSGTLTNQVGGQMGVQRVFNHGLIDNAGSLYAPLQNYSQINNTGTLTTGPTATFATANHGVITNSGALTNESVYFFNRESGEIANTGSFVNSTTLRNYGTLTSELPGTLTNNGVLSNYAGGRIEIFGEGYNNGQLINEGSLAAFGVSNNAGGVLENKGDATLGEFYNREGATLTNTGMLQTQLPIHNYGTLNNQSGGTLNHGEGEFYNHGLLNNAGRMYSSDLHSVHNYGELVNSGTLDDGVVGLQNFGDISNTGTLTVNGYLTGNSGRITNSGAMQVNGNLSNYDRIGNEGNGIITVRNSGALNNYGILTNKDGSTLINDGDIHNLSGATLENGGILRNNYWLENHTGATLNNNGTLVNNYNLWNRDGDIHNHQTLNNRGTLANYGTLTNHATGNLINTGSLRLEVGSNLQNDGQITNTGSVSISRLFGPAAGIGTMTGTGTFTQTAGVLDVRGEMTQAAINLYGGRLTGTGTIQGNVLVDGATIEPGTSPGTLNINGNLDFLNGILEIEIGGLFPGQYDQLNITGAAYFYGGTIQFNFINGFLPKTNDFLAFLTADTINGLGNLSFAYKGLAPGFLFSVTESGGELIFTALNNGVPEPGTLILTGFGLGALAWLRRRRKAEVEQEPDPVLSSS